MTGGQPAGHAIRWTGDNIDAVAAFMHPDAPVVINARLIGVAIPEDMVVADVGDWIIRSGTTLTVQHVEDSDR